ncbi:MAG TPA: FAD-dependent oxidoreductase [Steroidobacteraceae bacterium]|nr:FAD-dependent oxidoreductase [Steroidobacteraceae bacterium]
MSNEKDPASPEHPVGAEGGTVRRNLGEDREIPRRDVLQGVLIGAATALTGSLLKPPAALALASDGVPATDLPGYYPPIRTGMRGSHPGSFEQAHFLRDGGRVGAAADTGEEYDLVVVGGGISGLAAAYFYRQRHGGARVLVLDNHDDFGGHAKRNEFHLDGGLQLLNGGTLMIDSPYPYSKQAAGLLSELGIDPPALSRRCEHHDFYQRLGLRGAVFFDRETFGRDHLAVGFTGPYRPTGTPATLHRALAGSPLSARAIQDIVDIETGAIDYLAARSDLTGAQKKDLLSRISYRDYLRDYVHAQPGTLAFYQAMTHGEWGCGIDAVSALDCWGFGYPGFKGLNLPNGSIRRMGYTPAGYHDTGGSYTFHFPDGNASIARLLVRSLVPAALPGSTAEDVVTAQADYGRLDRAGQPARIRLNSTVVHVQQSGGGVGGRVEVVYVRGGRPERVRARHCVLACYNMMIPYLCPSLPAPQKAAMHQLVKTPLVYTSVALANWRAFHKLGLDSVYTPGGYFTSYRLNWAMDIGGYHTPRHPDQPILLWMEQSPCQPGLSEFDQNRAGRAQLLATPFATFEHNIRDQLARALGPGGFDPARDIEAITVNRWPHGYAPEYNPLFDPDVPADQRPQALARKPFGSITIANSDCGGGAYTSVAIDQAWRAVGELPEA